jgi:transcription antitermination factor NusB
MMKMSLVREVSFKYLYHVNMSLFTVIESTKEDKYASFIEEMTNQFDETFAEFCTSYGRDDEEHPDNNISDEVKNLATKYIKDVFKNIESIVGSIQPHLKNQNISKIEKIDLCCLLLGAYELGFRDTPKKVVINETLTIGQKFGGSTTPQFLNAVLDKIK